jgi:hypothetical protein
LAQAAGEEKGEDMRKIRLPSPAMMVALLALLVALSGTAVAAVQVVPLAKRALVADNAKKLSGRTLNQIVAGIGGAVPQLVTVKSAPWSLNPSTSGDFSATCDAGQKAIAGGFDNPNGDALSIDTRPSSDGTGWRIFLFNLSTTAAASGNIYVVCLA